MRIDLLDWAVSMLTNLEIKRVQFIIQFIRSRFQNLIFSGKITINLFNKFDTRSNQFNNTWRRNEMYCSKGVWNILHKITVITKMMFAFKREKKRVSSKHLIRRNCNTHGNQLMWWWGPEVTCTAHSPPVPVRCCSHYRSVNVDDSHCSGYSYLLN